MPAHIPCDAAYRIDREPRGFADEAGLADPSLSIEATFVELERAGKTPNGTDRFQEARRILHQATHGHDTAAQAAEAAGYFLADHRAIRSGDAD